MQFLLLKIIFYCAFIKMIYEEKLGVVTVIKTKPRGGEEKKGRWRT